MLKLYGFKKVNEVARGNTRDLRVLWALEELKLPYELVGMDHPAKDLNSEHFRSVSPFEQIPVIDDDGVVLSESAAILIYLAKKAGRLIPADLAGESQVVRWSFAAMNSLEIPLMSLMMLDWGMSEGCTKYREFLVGWADRHLANLERWLKGREFIATAQFTVADILMAHVLTGADENTLLKQYPNVRAYKDRCLSRPSWKITLERYMKNVEPG